MKNFGIALLFCGLVALSIEYIPYEQTLDQEEAYYNQEEVQEDCDEDLG